MSARTTNPVILEICVESVEHAAAAEKGGADRIEFCSDLACGSVTPDATLLRAVRQRVRIPIHGMIRPRSGDFFYSEHEFETMKRDITIAKEVGLDGIVLGVLNASRQVDCERTRELVQLAQPLPVTFHRAFDQCPDLTSALEAVIIAGARRILTSGGKASAIDGLAEIEQLVKTAERRIVIMPGGGIRNVNVEQILQDTGAREIHTSLDSAGAKSADKAGNSSILGLSPSAALFEERVRRFKSFVNRG